MTRVRLPMSVTLSLALHAGGLLLYVELARLAPKVTTRTIDNVDLFIQVKRLAAAPAQARPAPPPSTMEFLKMALPAIPKAEPRRMEVRLPELKRPLLPAAPKLEDRGRVEQLAKVAALDLSQRRVEAVKIESRVVESRRAAALAALPRLEDVGRRRVRDLPAALALEERRQEAVSLQAIASLAAAPAVRRAAGPAEILREASPPERSRMGDKVAAFLPKEQPLALAPQAAPRPADVMGKVAAPPPAPPRRSAAAPIERKKGVEIEGPLADRKVVSYDIPEFPAWAKAQGVLDAEVKILFYVGPDGGVLPDLRVEHTSGFGRLDRLALESLRNWKFVPIGAQERQWGRITFHFILE